MVLTNEGNDVLKKNIETEKRQKKKFHCTPDQINDSPNSSYVCVYYHPQTDCFVVSQLFSVVVSIFFLDKRFGGVRGVMVIVIGNGHGNCHFYTRYIDDIFFIYTGIKRKLKAFLNNVNRMHDYQILP